MWEEGTGPGHTSSVQKENSVGAQIRRTQVRLIPLTDSLDIVLGVELYFPFPEVKSSLLLTNLDVSSVLVVVVTTVQLLYMVLLLHYSYREMKTPE